jgi:uncharacterized membrane-anchored protein YitT (DUF2179 family)
MAQCNDLRQRVAHLLQPLHNCAVPLPFQRSAPASDTVRPAPNPLRHSALDDTLGILTGTFVASLGLFILKSTAAVTGGTAGLALLVSYTAPIPFGLVFFLVNVPFFALALWKKGLNFTLRTVLAVLLVSALSSIHPMALSFEWLNPIYAVLAGNLLAGVGLLILFRHGASLGGFNILALILQERLGWRAGYTQMAMDVVVILAAFAVAPPWLVALSALGAVVLNLIVALNHRPGRYNGF